jgi:pyrroline-5-carboxylate reductase
MKGKKISFIGGGNMAEAILRGLLKKKMIAPKQLFVSEPREERTRFLSQKYRIHVTSDNKAAVRFGEIIILAVKPQIIKGVLQEIASVVTSKHVVISIAAGITIAFIVSQIGNDKRIVRTMPNTPSQIGEGAIALCGGGKATPHDIRVARELFAAVGTTVMIPEAHMDAVTGLSGSGPAYIFLIIEALTDGGVKMGLPRDVAQSLVLQTIIGAGRMVLETGDHPSKLKDLVTSPGGTTIAGLHVLEEKGIRGALINAVMAASERSRELSQALKP